MKYSLTIIGNADELKGVLDICGGADPAVAAEGAPGPVEAPDAAPAPERPEAAPEPPSFEVIRKAMMRAINDGKRDQCSELLAKRGAKRVTELPEGELAAFLAEVEAI